MSFEGYHQVLCKNGHHFTTDLGFDEESWECPYCKEKLAWTHIVDTTNGSFENGKQIDGYIELKVAQKAKVCECDKCGNEHVIEPVRYKIPKEA